MTLRFIQPGELLELADDLAYRNGGRGKPKTIRLRRGISSAYYAVFHRLTQHAATRLLGPGWTEKHAEVGRWIAHADLDLLARAATGQGNKSLRSVLDPVDQRLVDLATDFIDLQDARHAADYDDFFEVSKTSALTYVDVARGAVSAADSLFRDQEESYWRFLGLAVGGVKVAKAR